MTSFFELVVSTDFIITDELRECEYQFGREKLNKNLTVKRLNMKVWFYVCQCRFCERVCWQLNMIIWSQMQIQVHLLKIKLVRECTQELR